MWQPMLHSCCCWAPGGAEEGKWWWCVEKERLRRNTQICMNRCSRWHQTGLLSVLGSKVGSEVEMYWNVLKATSNVFCYYFFYVCLWEWAYSKMYQCLILTLIFWQKLNYEGSSEACFLHCLRRRHSKSALIKNLFSSTGLQHLAGPSVSWCCLFTCAQGFIKPISKKNVRSQSSLSAQRHVCQSRDGKNKMYHAPWNNGDTQAKCCRKCKTSSSQTGTDQARFGVFDHFEESYKVLCGDILVFQFLNWVKPETSRIRLKFQNTYIFFGWLNVPEDLFIAYN